MGGRSINNSNKLPNLLTLYFAGHDHSSHENGTASQLSYLQDVVDPLIDKLMNGGTFYRYVSTGKTPLITDYEDFSGIKGMGLFDKTIFIILSDHGQTDIEDDAKVTDFWEIEPGSMIVCENGATTHIYVKAESSPILIDGSKWPFAALYDPDIKPLAEFYWKMKEKKKSNWNIEHILVRDAKTYYDWNGDYKEYVGTDEPQALSGYLNEVANRLDSKRSGDLILISKPGTSFSRKDGADHGNINNEDTNIPLIFAGSLVKDKPGLETKSVKIIDIAPTIAKLLGVEMNNCDGQPIPDILKQD